MEVMKSSEVKYGTITIEVVHNPDIALSVDNFDIQAFLTFKSAEDLLGWKQYSASEKIQSKQAKALQGEGFTPSYQWVVDSKGRKNEMGVIPFCLLRLLVGHELSKGNEKAIELVNNGFPAILSCDQKKEIKRSGIVYVIRIGQSRFYKIGMTTKNVEERVKSIACGHPEVCIVKTFQSLNVRNLESRIHCYFKSRNTNGEWFDFSDVSEGEAIEMISSAIKELT